ncbi:hypothetical protein ABZS81_05420 [Streptomyces sp. NPDC005318]|uniref:hypothetical protein n=1 Tax=Streptomyces sp. NPDC005318 TaxID=3157031 RepID=UPI0033B4F692
MTPGNVSWTRTFLPQWQTLAETTVKAAFHPDTPLLVASTTTGPAAQAVLHHRQPGLNAQFTKIRADVTTRRTLRDFLLTGRRDRGCC